MDAQYQELAKRIGLGDSERIPKLFKMLADEAEAELLLSLPGNAPALAEKLGRPEDKVAEMIQTLFVKGLAFPVFRTDPPIYRLCRDMIQFHDATILWPDAPRDFLDLWQEWVDVEWLELAKIIEKTTPLPFMRVIPVGMNVQADAHILAFEDVKDIIENSKNLAVTNCTCRLTAQRCDHTLEACIQVNRGADYAIARGTGRRLTKAEALDICLKSEEEGLIHSTFNQKSVDMVICNCCPCCCQMLPVLIKHGTNLVSPSRFQADVDQDLCSGCEICLERCYFGAMEMTARDGDEDELVATVKAEKCLGCGLCQVICPEEAISLLEVRPVDHVPDKFSH